MEGLKALRSKLNIPILATETVTLDELHLYLAQGATDLARGDVLLKGGITGLKKAFALCELWGMGLEIHAANAPLLDVANLHVACSVMGGDIETHHPVFRFGLKNSPLEIDAEGFLHLPDAPGLGVKLDWDWVEDHTAEVLEGAGTWLIKEVPVCPKRPNILWIGVDQMRADTPGYSGNEICQTPNRRPARGGGCQLSSTRLHASIAVFSGPRFHADGALRLSSRYGHELRHVPRS